jgi:tRNA (mo5U34)-methyltransferase
MTLTTSALREELIRLGPWHLEVDITPGLSTAAYLDAPAPAYPSSFGEVSLYRPREGFIRRLERIFPDGLEGRSVLDCACNCGGYLFWAKELGAGQCFGFDAREHWIRQARFLAEHRSGPGADIRFEVRDLYELPELDLEPFDITLFYGIFYHLPMPVTGMKIAADLTRELMIVNTATRNGLPGGTLAASEEGKVELASGIYGLNWFPAGPDVLSRIFQWLGFTETRCSRWRTIVPQQPPSLGRMEVMGARSAETFRSFDLELDRDRLIDSVRFIANAGLPPEAKVLVAGDDDDLLQLDGRRVGRFPGDTSDSDQGDGHGAVQRLEKLRAEGARYLLVPATAFAWLEQERELKEHLENHYTAAWREHGICVLFSLEPEPRH